MKIKPILIVLILSILLNIFTIRDILKYEPETYKYRWYYNLRQRGYFEKDLNLSELKSNHTMIVLTMGQSNAGSSSNAKYTPHDNVLNYYNGHIYKASDPLIGMPGSGGSVWGLLADKIIDKGLYKKVIIIPIAEGSTDITNWSSGACYQKLKATLEDLNKHHIKLTYIFWHHGEANNGSSKEIYKKDLGIIVSTIRKYNQDAPFFCSIASYNPLAVTKPFGVDTLIEDAQKGFVKENKDVYLGPNTDQLIYAIDRHDSWHFSAYGKEQYANLWLKAIEEMKK